MNDSEIAQNVYKTIADNTAKQRGILCERFFKRLFWGFVFLPSFVGTDNMDRFELFKQ